MHTRLFLMALLSSLGCQVAGCSKREEGVASATLLSPEEIAMKYRSLPAHIGFYLALVEIVAGQPDQGPELLPIIEKIEPCPDPIQAPADWGSITVEGEVSPDEVALLRDACYFLSRALPAADPRRPLLHSLRFQIGTEADTEIAEKERPFASGRYLLALDFPTSCIVVDRNVLPYHPFMLMVLALGHELHHAVHHRSIGKTRLAAYRAEVEAHESEARTAGYLHEAIDDLIANPKLHEAWDFEKLRAFWHASLKRNVARAMERACEYRIAAGALAVGQLSRYEAWQALTIRGADAAYNTEAKWMVRAALALSESKDLSDEDRKKLSAVLTWFLDLSKKRPEVRTVFQEMGGVLADLEGGIAACDALQTRRKETERASEDYNTLLEHIRQSIRKQHSL